MRKHMMLSFILIMSICFAKNAILAAEKPEILVQMGHSSSVNSVAFSPDGKYIVSGSEDKAIKLWDIPTGLEQWDLRLKPNEKKALKIKSGSST